MGDLEIFRNLRSWTAARAIVKYEINIVSYYHPLTQRNTALQTRAPGTPRTGGDYLMKKKISLKIILQCDPHLYKV